jgi:hypothetical protein
MSYLQFLIVYQLTPTSTNHRLNFGQWIFDDFCSVSNQNSNEQTAIREFVLLKLQILACALNLLLQIRCLVKLCLPS